jgi:multidrug efflux pump subunit AcrA (membrane-fusion protein)
MRHHRLLAALLLFAVFLIAGCDGDRTLGITAPPPATSTTTAATEKIIGDRASAMSQLQVDGANVKAGAAAVKAANAEERAAKSDADRAKADLDRATALQGESAAIAQQKLDEGTVTAKDSELSLQRASEIIGQSDRFYALGCIIVLIAVFLIKDGNMQYGSIALCLAGTCFLIPSAVKGIVEHETLIQAALLIGGIGLLAYHFRVKIEAAAKQAEAEAKVLGAALEHAVMHIDQSKAVQAAEHEVSSVFWTSLYKVEAAAKALELKLHLIKNPAAAAPTAATLMQIAPAKS